MRPSASLATWAVTLTTLAVAAAVGAGRRQPNPPTRPPPMTFPHPAEHHPPAGVAIDPTTHMAYAANPENDHSGLVSAHRRGGQLQPARRAVPGTKGGDPMTTTVRRSRPERLPCCRVPGPGGGGRGQPDHAGRPGGQGERGTPGPSPTYVADDPVVQHRFAIVDGDLQAARAFYLDAISDAWETLNRGDRCSLRQGPG
jgi:hypothetical protein